MKPSTCPTCPYASLYVPYVPYVSLRVPLRVLRVPTCPSTCPSTCPLYESLYVPTLRVPLRALRVPLRVLLHLFSVLLLRRTSPKLTRSRPRHQDTHALIQLARCVTDTFMSHCQTACIAVRAASSFPLGTTTTTGFGEQPAQPFFMQYIFDDCKCHCHSFEFG